MANGAIAFENAQIVFRNFSGKADKYNPAGRKNFCLILNKEQAEDLASQGYSIKQFKARDEEDEPDYYISVKVNYAGPNQPKVWLVTKKNKTLLDEESVSSIDYAEIENIDLIISPYNWTMPGPNGDRSGTSAYLKNMYVTVVEDEFASKYEFDDEPEEVPFD